MWDEQNFKGFLWTLRISVKVVESRLQTRCLEDVSATDSRCIVFRQILTDHSTAAPPPSKAELKVRNIGRQLQSLDCCQVPLRCPGPSISDMASYGTGSGR